MQYIGDNSAQRTGSLLSKMIKVVLIVLGIAAIALGLRNLSLAPDDANSGFTTAYYFGASFWVFVGVVLVFIGGRR